MKPPSPTLRKLAKMLPRLATNDQREILATVEAMKRSLASTGHDLHDFAEVIENSWRALRETNCARNVAAPTWAQLSTVERDKWINSALSDGNLNAWESEFLKSIRTLHWRISLSKKQVERIDQLLAKTWNGGRHD